MLFTCMSTVVPGTVWVVEEWSWNPIRAVAHSVHVAVVPDGEREVRVHAQEEAVTGAAQVGDVRARRAGLARLVRECGARKTEAHCDHCDEVFHWSPRSVPGRTMRPLDRSVANTV